MQNLLEGHLAESLHVSVCECISTLDLWLLNKKSDSCGCACATLSDWGTCVMSVVSLRWASGACADFVAEKRTVLCVIYYFISTNCDTPVCALQTESSFICQSYTTAGDWIISLWVCMWVIEYTIHCKFHPGCVCYRDIFCFDTSVYLHATLRDDDNLDCPLVSPLCSSLLDQLSYMLHILIRSWILNRSESVPPAVHTLMNPKMLKKPH